MVCSLELFAWQEFAIDNAEEKIRRRSPDDSDISIIINSNKNDNNYYNGGFLQGGDQEIRQFVRKGKSFIVNTMSRP